MSRWVNVESHEAGGGLSSVYLISNPLSFGGFQAPPSKTFFSLIGAPYDGTSTYRPGSRFGPRAIREASIEIETYSLRADLDFADVMVYDEGDVDVVHGDLTETLKRIEVVTRELIVANRLPIIIGGEHTITYGAVKAFGDVAVLAFDAHMDMRDHYPHGQRYSHATVLRRISELMGPKKLLVAGLRAFCKEEYEYMKQRKIFYITSNEIIEGGKNQIANMIKENFEEFSKVYISIDLDVLDPAYAPGVGNPEPEGLNIKTFLDILSNVTDRKVCGFDVVELTPPYDNGVAAIQAAKIIFELCCFIHQAKRKERLS